MSPEVRRWLRIEQGLIPFVLNVVLNAGIAWLIFRGQASLTLFGEQGVGVDLVVTAILLPLLVCLINSAVIRRQVESGKRAALASPVPESAAAMRPAWMRALMLAAAAVLLGALPMIVLVGAIAPISAMTFVGVKGLWAGALAGVVSPFVAWWALVAASTRSGDG